MLNNAKKAQNKPFFALESDCNNQVAKAGRLAFLFFQINLNTLKTIAGVIVK